MGEHTVRLTGSGAGSRYQCWRESFGMRKQHNSTSAEPRGMISAQPCSHDWELKIVNSALAYIEESYRTLVHRKYFRRSYRTFFRCGVH